MIVRKLRLQRGWTQEHLAEMTGLSVRSIQRLERGQPGSLESMNSLAAVCIGLLVHGLNVFEVINIFGPNWENKSKSAWVDHSSC
jgi:transcriptional regulator with XRE-family HTH domain